MGEQAKFVRPHWHWLTRHLDLVCTQVKTDFAVLKLQPAWRRFIGKPFHPLKQPRRVERADQIVVSPGLQRAALGLLAGLVEHNG